MTPLLRLGIGFVAVGAVLLILWFAGDAFYAQLGDNPAEALVALLKFIARASVVVFNAPFNQGIIERALEQHLGSVPELDWIDTAVTKSGRSSWPTRSFRLRSADTRSEP